MITQVGDRAFSAAGPRCWNRLFAALHSANSIDSFNTIEFSTTFTSEASVRNLGVTSDPRLSFSYHISNLPGSCFMHIPDLHRIRPMLDFKSASTIATSIVHSKLDYCNFLCLLKI